MRFVLAKAMVLTSGLILQTQTGMYEPLGVAKLNRTEIIILIVMMIIGAIIGGCFDDLFKQCGNNKTASKKTGR